MGILAFEAQSCEQNVNGGQSMSKITFLGAGSTVFAKNVLGDCMLTPALGPLSGICRPNVLH
ncbi:hypothetical protein [Paenibacillus ottowii]